MPPIGPDGGAWSTVFSLEVHIVNGPAVMSINLVLVFLVNVPIELNETVPPVGTASGPLLNIVVLVAAGRGVNVGVGILGVFVGVFDDIGDGVNVGVAGGPFAIVIDCSEKPGALVAVGVPLLPPLQLRRIAPKTNNTTGVTTSHLSHRDNIKS
jgi:hypothetical protein